MIKKVKEVMDFLSKNMQEEVALWTEDKVKLKLKDWEKEREESRDKIEFEDTTIVVPADTDSQHLRLSSCFTKS
ncbi:MAG: hypothetical protein N2380_09510 [bacterium]|nr:hypothetical protein [bacterium]